MFFFTILQQVLWFPRRFDQFYSVIHIYNVFLRLSSFCHIYIVVVALRLLWPLRVWLCRSSDSCKTSARAMSARLSELLVEPTVVLLTKYLLSNGSTLYIWRVSISNNNQGLGSKVSYLVLWRPYPIQSLSAAYQWKPVRPRSKSSLCLSTPCWLVSALSSGGDKRQLGRRRRSRHIQFIFFSTWRTSLYSNKWLVIYAFGLPIVATSTSW